MFRGIALVLAAGGALAAQTEAPKPAQPSRVGELERLGEGGREVLVLGIDAPGFDQLKPSQRKFAYYLYRAAAAGHDILYLQSHPASLDIRNLLEAIYEKKDGLDPKIAEGLEEYLKLVWVNHGQYHHWGHTKFTPRLLTFETLKKAAAHAKKQGATFPLRKGETLEKLLLRLKPAIFDPKVDPIQVNQVAGADPVATSSNGLYDKGLTLADIEALAKEMQSKVNVRFARVKGKAGKFFVEPQEFKVGGVYGEQLGNVVFWLKKALAYVENERVEVEKDGVKKTRFEPNAQQKKALEDLIAFLETGDEAKFRDHSIAWLKTKSTVDYLNGFIESYKDPRAVIGSYEAVVSFASDSDKIGRLSQNALYFESKMPWKDAWRRPKVEPPVATVVNLIAATGDAGPMGPVAYNLPNYDDIRRTHGSKNVVLLNVQNAGSAQVKTATLEAFYQEADRDLVAKFGDSSYQWLVYMHEVIGHGSGQADASLQGVEPSVKIGPTYNALEECRADAVALYQFLDPKVVEIGAVAEADHLAAAKAMYLRYLVGQLAANGTVEGDTVREAHFRGRQLVLNYLTQPGKDFGVRLEVKDGKHFITVEDVKQAREGVGEILARLQELKAMGDREGAAKFFDDYGTKVNKAWQADAKARQEALNLPKERALVFPQLVPVLGERNERQVLKDVVLETKESLAEQMLRLKRMSKSRELEVN